MVQQVPGKTMGWDLAPFNDKYFSFLLCGLTDIEDKMERPYSS